MLIDLTKDGITGKELETMLGSANITVNKNAIPFDTRSPFITSGNPRGHTGDHAARHGTKKDMELIGQLIAKIVKEGRRRGGAA